ncbi:MAG: DUF2029 domain-containing protein [Planctomycetes bacterium]|nr:DUF2029 domain-containing protein [Planctomycetota bacterium]
MTTAAASPTLFRRLLLAVGVIVIIFASGSLLNNLFFAEKPLPIDFAEYWAAGHLNAAGADPYSGPNVRAVQREIGLEDIDTAIMMWNPPWTLSLVMPIGAMHPRTAYGVWMLVNLALVGVAAVLFWRGFGGLPRFRGLAILIALSFGPTVFLIGAAQITAFVLFGLAGFLYFARNDRPLCAGICVAFTAIKPHLLVLFAVWLLLEATRSAFGRWVVVGGLLVGVFMSVPPGLANPAVWKQYIEATTGPSSADHRHVSEWTPPLIGWWLRQMVPGQPFAVQWLPMAIAVPGFVAWWFVNRKQPPQWEERLPWVVGASLVVAPYGAYAYDLVLLLVPVLATAVHLTRFPNRRVCVIGLVFLFCVNAAILAMMLAQLKSPVYVWATPVTLCGCAILFRLTTPEVPQSLARCG